MYPTTSFKYTFQNILADRIILDAFAQISKNPALVSGVEYQEALQSLNMILNLWISKQGVNLFTIEQNIIGLNEGQSGYSLPSNTSRILEAILVNTSPIIFPAGTVFLNTNKPILNSLYTISSVFTSIVQNGEALSSARTNDILNPYDCFYGCYMPFPIISASPFIRYVGITSGKSKELTIAIDYLIQPDTLPISGLETLANDPNWQTILEIPTEYFYAGVTKYFALPYSIQVPFIRIREVNDKGLWISNIQFYEHRNVQQLKPISRDTYTKAEGTSGARAGASVYYVNRSKYPSINLYPTPDNNFDLLVYNRVRSVQDVGTEINTLDISPRFIEPITAALAARLAKLYGDPTQVQLMNQFAEISFNLAAKEDSENLPLYMQLGG